jgi:hypothetical protein
MTYEGGLTGDYNACASCERRGLCWAICRNPFNDAVLLPVRYKMKAASVGGLFL